MDNQRKHLEVVPTEDGSSTLYNAYFDECCHSTSGAYQETLTHYFEGCQVANKSIIQQELNILEVGFGSGLGLKVTIEQARLNKLTKPINFISLELDRASCDWALTHTLIDQRQLSDFLKYEQDQLVGQIDNINVVVLIGDARRELPHYMQQQHFQFDCIYQDAFSPKKNPQLWSIEWFAYLRSISRQDTVLSTYSSSVSIRKSLSLAGWTIYEGVRFGNKRSSTRATLLGETSQSILESMQRSPAQALTEADPELKEALKC